MQPFTTSCTINSNRGTPRNRSLQLDDNLRLFTWTIQGLGDAETDRSCHTCVIFDSEYKFGSVRAHSMKVLSIALARGYWIARQSASTNGKNKIRFLAMETELLPPLKGFLVSIDVSKEDWKVSPVFALPRGTPNQGERNFSPY